jgi:DNA polymerase V
MDRINRRYPKAISIAATGVDKNWKPKAERASPHYTTNWKELVGVKC